MNRNDDGHAWYNAQLKDPRWQAKRQPILQRDRHRCRFCGHSDKKLHVDHLFYLPGRAPWEYRNEDLWTLCADCHLLKHKLEKGAKVTWNAPRPRPTPEEAREQATENMFDMMEAVATHSSLQDLCAIMDNGDMSLAYDSEERQWFFTSPWTVQGNQASLLERNKARLLNLMPSVSIEESYGPSGHGETWWQDRYLDYFDRFSR